MEGFKEIRCFRTEKVILLGIDKDLIEITYTNKENWEYISHLVYTFDDFSAEIIKITPCWVRGKINIPVRYYNMIDRSLYFEPNYYFTPLDKALIIQTIKDQLKLPENEFTTK